MSMRARGRDSRNTPALKAASEHRGSSSSSLLCRLWPCLMFCIIAHACMVIFYPSFTSEVLPEPLRHMPGYSGNSGESFASPSILAAGSSIPNLPLLAATTTGSESSASAQPAAWASSVGWLSDVYAAVPSKEALLVHQPFFWTELAATAHVRIGNFQRDSKHGKKGFAKADRSNLWMPVVEWEAARSSSVASSQPADSMQHKATAATAAAATVVFAKCSLCTLLSANRSLVRGPIVLLGTFNDNWGILADGLNGTIHQMQSITNMLDPRCGRSMADLEAFLADPRLWLWVVNHHAYRRGLHTKVLTLPLGVQDRGVWAIGHRFLTTSSSATKKAGSSHKGDPMVGVPKKRLFELNNNAWRFRAALNDAVNASFGHSIVNSYHTFDKNATASEHRRVRVAYLRRLAESVFVLCPPGLGMDSYRVYEVLLMGSIPIVEASPGLDRALHQLPALIVRNLAQRLTPALLNHVAQTLWPLSPPLLSSPHLPVDLADSLRATQEVSSSETAIADKFAQKRWPWRFESLTGAYWTSLVAAAAASSSSAESHGDLDGWVASGRQAGADDPTCHCWFPAGVCLDLPQCRDGLAQLHSNSQLIQ